MHHASKLYRGESETDAKEAAVIAEQAPSNAFPGPAAPERHLGHAPRRHHIQPSLRRHNNYGSLTLRRAAGINRKRKLLVRRMQTAFRCGPLAMLPSVSRSSLVRRLIRMVPPRIN